MRVSPHYFAIVFEFLSNMTTSRERKRLHSLTVRLRQSSACTGVVLQYEPLFASNSPDYMALTTHLGIPEVESIKNNTLLVH